MRFGLRREQSRTGTRPDWKGNEAQSSSVVLKICDTAFQALTQVKVLRGSNLTGGSGLPHHSSSAEITHYFAYEFQDCCTSTRFLGNHPPVQR